MIDLRAKSIPHSQHRYSTVGDWIVNADGKRTILVSDHGNTDYEFLIVLHEMIEQHLCEKRGITTDMVDKFDMDFEANKLPGEPGDSPQAPYYKEHQFATIMERLMCNELGLDWQEYLKAGEALCASS